MIIANLNGGLGNQMFQYANAKAVAVRKGVNFLVDTSLYEKNRMHHGFELGKIFKLPVSVATKADLKQVLGYLQSPLPHRILARLPLPKTFSKKFITEPHFEYWDGLLNCPNEAYLFGYWQSERYFLDCEADIRREFTFQPFQDQSNIELAQKIQDSQCAVSVHVRRGDFVNNPKANAYHGALSPSYYSDALAHLARTLPTMECFLFSDDIKWVKENLDLGAFKVHFVSHNMGIYSYQDMALMSLCDHHVIANSSFSWWGAWLNASQDKIVIAPKYWFVQPINTKDLIPASWIKL